jgi:5'-nucleotidase (lipoprotein e(P4) family)
MVAITRKQALAALLTAPFVGAQAVPRALAQEGPPANDLLLATLWTQRSVEFKATALGAFTLARMRLDQALADKSWTGAPAEQTGAFGDLPPAIIADVDETLVDNSAYQVWMMKNDKTFSLETWNKFVESRTSTAVPGAVGFCHYAASKGVKIFYITNRDAPTKEATRKNMDFLGFPMGGNVDTLLMQRERPEWGSAKGTRRAVVTKDYRVLLNLGDNFGDFDDRYRGTEAERLAAFDQSSPRWGREWIMIANPTYGSFDTAPFGHDFKKPRGEQRRAKWEALQGWAGP